MVTSKPPASAIPASPVSARNSATDSLTRHFSPEAKDAFARFETTRQPADADFLVIAIMLDHIHDEKVRRAGTPADSASLVADLGFDSVAITEMVFFLEDLFQIRISNEEILRVRTVGDLRAFVQQKLAGLAPVDPVRPA